MYIEGQTLEILPKSAKSGYAHPFGNVHKILIPGWLGVFDICARPPAGFLEKHAPIPTADLG